MADIYLFPEDQDRQAIHEAVRARAAGEISEFGFAQCVSGLLRSFRIRQLVCGSFMVRDCGDFHTPKGAFPVVAISARGGQSADGKCPACGKGPGRWLRGDREITAFCAACGCVYSWPVAEEHGL